MNRIFAAALLFALLGCAAMPGLCAGTLTLPESLTEVGDYAFYGDTGFSAIALGSAVKSIGDYAFSGCKGLTALTLPEAVTSIGAFAFSGCEGIEGSLTVPASAQTIGASAFSDCGALEGLTLDAAVESMGSAAFSGCDKLVSLTFVSGDVNYASGTFPEAVETVTFEEDVETVYAETFRNCVNITKLIFRGASTAIVGSFADFLTGPVTVLAPFSGDASNLIDGEQFVSPTYRALLIGQQYKGATQEGKSIELHGCIEDAESIGRMLLDKRDGAKQLIEYEGQPYEFIRTEQTASQILAAIPEVLDATTDDDVSLFYYSGHGSPGGYLIGTNSGEVGFDQYIKPSALYEALNAVKGKKIVIIDACYSGSLIGRGEAESDFAEDFISAFSMASRSSELAKDDFFVIVAASVKEGTGISVSATAYVDGSTVYYGLFTRYYAEAFGWNRLFKASSGYGDWFEELEAEPFDLRADADGDNRVTLKEAFVYANDGVEKYKTNNKSMNLQQVTKVWPYDSDGEWPDIANLVLFGWAESETDSSGADGE